MLECIAFQLGTEPDVDAIRCVYDLDPALSEIDVAEYAYQRQRALLGVDLLPPHLLRIAHATTLKLSGGRALLATDARDPSAERAMLASFLSEIRASGLSPCCWGNASQQLEVLRCKALLYRLDLSPINACVDVSGSAFGRIPMTHLARLLGLAFPSEAVEATIANATESLSRGASEVKVALALISFARLRCVAGQLAVETCESIEALVRAAIPHASEVR